MPKSIPPSPPAPHSPNKVHGGLVGCEFLEGRSGQHPPEPKGPALCPTQVSWRCSPAVPGRRQRSGSLGTHQSPTGGYRVAPPGCGSALGCRPQMMSHLHSGDGGLWNPISGRGPRLEPPAWPLPLSRLHTCLSPDGQVLLLLDVQHDLQATAHAPSPAGQPVLWICIEGITLPIASIDLGVGREEEGRWKEWLRQVFKLRAPCPLQGPPDLLGHPCPIFQQPIYSSASPGMPSFL